MEEEIKILHQVADRFRNVSTNDIVEISRLEEAREQNHLEKKDISYKYAFELTEV